MKTLYFDIDGTLLAESEPKRRLADGEFEGAARRAGFERLICVGNVGAIIRVLRERGQAPDALGMVYELCRGVFRDETWFREVTSLVLTPERRAQVIDFSGDWWYLDDMASDFLALEGLEEVYRLHNGGRVFVPDPNGDGGDVLEWVRGGPSS